MEPLSRPSIILVIRMSSIGDIVLTADFFSGLRRLYPKSRILWLVRKEYAEILSSHPAIDETVSWDKKKEPLSGLTERLRKKKPDLVIDLHAIPRTRILSSCLGKDGARILTCEKHSLSRILLILFKIKPRGEARLSVRERYALLLRKMGLKNPSKQNRFSVPGPILRRIGKKIPAGFRGHITVSEEATAETKRWDKFPLLLESLLAAGRKVVLIGGSRTTTHAGLEKLYPNKFLNLTGRTSILESAAVIRLGRALVCNDTGMMHIGDALGIRTVSLWGPTVREFGFFPSQPNSRVIERRDLKCRPCSLHGGRKCPLGHFRCMRKISVATVMTALS